MSEDTGWASEPETPDDVAAMDSAPDDDVAAMPDDDEPVTNMKAFRQARAEAQQLRQRLHEVETTEAGNAAKLAAYEKREIERAAAEVLVDPSDIWRLPAEAQQEWIDSEFGEVTASSVIESARALAADKPHLARPDTPPTPPPTDRPIEKLRTGASPPDEKKTPTWSSVLR